MPVLRVSGIIFDLDGTLVDSQNDLASTVNSVRRSYGKPPLSLEVIRSFVGNGVLTLMERALPDEKGGELTRAVEKFKEHYREHLLDTTVPFQGIPGLIKHLKKSHTLAVLTNKPEKNAKAILEGLGLIGYFSLVRGGDSFSVKKPHPGPVIEMLHALGLDPAKTVLAGDGVNDILAARAACIRSIAVGYGYTPKAVLENLSPDLFAATVAELEQLFSD